MKRQPMVFIFAAISLLASLAGLRAESKQQNAGENQATAAVNIDNFSFGPAALKVAVGTNVKWTNKDDIPHTVVSTDRLFKSHALDTDDAFSYKFTKAGTYEYFCSLHPKMTGKVVVE